MEDVKQPSETGMMCTISGNTYFYSNDDIGLFNVININELLHGSSRIMPATEEGKLCVNIQQVDGTEQVHNLWSVKFCPKAGVNLFSLLCELSQEKGFQVTTKTTSL